MVSFTVFQNNSKAKMGVKIIRHFNYQLIVEKRENVWLRGKNMVPLAAAYYLQIL